MRNAAGWLIAAALIAAGGYWLTPEPEIIQPIDFSHEKHLLAKRAEGPITCATCHKFFKTRRTSGRPGVSICASCHATTKPKTPEMAKLRRYIDEKREIPWKRVYKAADHVYYSHRTHVVDAKLFCETCHGPVGSMKKALTRPLVPITMDTCIDCHRRTRVEIPRNGIKGSGAKGNGKKSVRFVTTDCNACHK